jgi:hypothetical protein
VIDDRQAATAAKKGEAMRHLTREELEAGLAEIARSPKDEGILELIARRPQVGEREVLQTAELDPLRGLVGDNWGVRRDPRTPDGSPLVDSQLNVMNARVIALLARDKGRWALAGDQLYIDLDLAAVNLPAGTRLGLGSAVIEVTAIPHTGCQKFVQRFGLEAMKFVNSPLGRAHHLRGINAKVVQAGTIRVGDAVKKLAG